MPWISHAPPFIPRICLVVRGRRRSCCSDIPFCAPRSTVLSCAIWHRQWLRSATFANWNAKDRSVIGLNEVAAGIRTRVLSRARGIITRSPDCTRRAVTGSSIIQGANLGIDQFPDVACLLPHSRLTRASVQILRQGAGGCGMPGWKHHRHFGDIFVVARLHSSGSSSFSSGAKAVDVSEACRAA